MIKKINSIISLALAAIILFPSMGAYATTEIRQAPMELVIDSTEENIIEGEEVKEEIISDKVESLIDDKETEDSIETNDAETSPETGAEGALLDEEEVEDESIEVEGLEVEESIVGEAYEIEDGTEVASYSIMKFEREEFNLKAPTLYSYRTLKNKTNSSYEIALAYSDGSYTYVDKAETYEEAKEIAINTPVPAKDEMVLPTVIDENGQVVYSTKTMGRIWKHINGKPDPTFSNNSYVYSSSSLNSAYTYINQGYVDDVPVIEDTGKAAKIQVSGYSGWVNKDVASGNYDLVLVPINQVTNPSYYSVKDGVLYHFISSNLIEKTEKGHSLRLGPAPSYLKTGVKYLSYDGNYFYEGSDIALGLERLISDLQGNHKNNSVNSSDPYYNYYNYLPFRSKTMYTAEELNNFINANTQENSKLRGTGKAFIDAQDTYGVNALLALGVAINESAWGVSSIALNKNNLFGMNAVDSSPGESANYYKTVTDCINEFTKYYISRGYADPADWRYFGGFLGNKNMGANIKYASDPFWGEKAAAHAFTADYYLAKSNIEALKDFNAFQIIMFTGENQVCDLNGNLLYNVFGAVSGYGAYPGTVAIITDKAEKYINGSYWLEIYPERNTPVKNGGEANEFQGNYNWNGKANILSKNIRFINASKSEVLPVDPTYKNRWKESNGKWYFYDGNGLLTKGWKEIGGKWYYFDKLTSVMVTGWLQDNGNWYYFNSNGDMAVGLNYIDGKAYCFDSSGKRIYGWQTINGSKYYFQSTGDAKVGWFKDAGQLYYFQEDGKMATGLINIDGKNYYLNEKGVMQTGWKQIGGTWYYFLSSGDARTGWLNDAGQWYYFHNDGKMAIGLTKVEGKLYYLCSTGAMLTGWQKINGTWYYFLSAGDARTGWLKDSGQWYYFHEDGNMAIGLTKIEGKLYYLCSTGAMVTGWQTVNGTWYYFLSSGEARIGWLNDGGKWYYLNKDGKMATGWIEVDGNKYYLYNNGVMAANTTIDGIYLDSSGAARK